VKILLGKEKVVVVEKVGPSGHPKDKAMLPWCRPPIEYIQKTLTT
jgi:hypothetical protein